MRILDALLAGPMWAVMLRLLLIVGAVVGVAAYCDAHHGKRCISSHLQPMPMVVGKVITIQFLPVCDESVPDSVAAPTSGGTTP